MGLSNKIDYFKGVVGLFSYKLHLIGAYSMCK